MWFLWKKLLFYVIVLGTASYFGFEWLPVSWSGGVSGSDADWNGQVAAALGSPGPTAKPADLSGQKTEAPNTAHSSSSDRPTTVSITQPPSSTPAAASPGPTAGAGEPPAASPLTDKAAPSSTPQSSTQAAIQPISINRADWQELTELPGIGETKAKAIVEYRTRHGSFRTIDELSEVKGIGPKTVDKLRKIVTL